jgi:uncharacterized membrane protein
MPTSERFMVSGIRRYPTPLLVGGSLQRVTSDSIRRAIISVEDVMSIYLSMGATISQFLPKPF